MNTLKAICVTLILFVISACSTSEIYSDQDESANLAHYKTFAWYPTPIEDFKNDNFNNQIIENNIKRNATNFLIEKGYVKETDSPDVIFEYHIMVEKKTRQEQQPIYNNSNTTLNNPYAYSNPGIYRNPNNYRNYGNYDPYWRGNTYNPYNAYNNAPYIIGYKTVNIDYQEGTLTISAIDRITNRLVWRGWSIGTIVDPVDYGLQIQKDLPKIFKSFPDQEMLKRN